MPLPAPVRDQRLYQSPPNSGGNDGALPTVYDPVWQGYTNLTTSQIVAFQGFPQDLMKYAAQRRWMAEISGVTVAGVPLNTTDRDLRAIAGLKQAFDTSIITTTRFLDANGNRHTVDAAAVTMLYTGVVQFIDNLYLAEDTVISGIQATPQTITTRSQIDAVYGPLSPNSPSALNPSPT